MARLTRDEFFEHAAWVGATYFDEDGEAFDVDIDIIITDPEKRASLNNNLTQHPEFIPATTKLVEEMRQLGLNGAETISFFCTALTTAMLSQEDFNEKYNALMGYLGAVARACAKAGSMMGQRHPSVMSIVQSTQEMRDAEDAAEDEEDEDESAGDWRDADGNKLDETQIDSTVTIKRSNYPDLPDEVFESILVSASKLFPRTAIVVVG